MAQLRIFSGKISALPESGRPSGIVKSPALFPVAIGNDGLVGDEQADRRVHGGPDKAVHLYPAIHYRRLAARFPELAAAFVPGSIGENLSTEALDERHVRVGDIWRLGTARLQVCQPRKPCWKIDDRYRCEGIARFIAEESIAGWYWRVVQAGRVEAGDTLELETAADAPTLRDALTLLAEHRPSVQQLERLIHAPGIADSWRDSIAKRRDWLRANA